MGICQIQSCRTDLPQSALNMFMLHLQGRSSSVFRPACLSQRWSKKHLDRRVTRSRKSVGEDISPPPFLVFSTKLNSSSNAAITEQVEVRVRQTTAELNQDWSVTRLRYGYVYGTVKLSLKSLHQRQISDQTCLHLNCSPRLPLEPVETNRLLQGTATDQYSSSANWSSPVKHQFVPTDSKGSCG